MREINISENDRVCVVLTKYGADQMNRHFRWLNSYSTTDSVRFKDNYKEDDEYTTMLWNVMSICYSNKKSTEKCFKQIKIIRD